MFSLLPPTSADEFVVGEEDEGEEEEVNPFRAVPSHVPGTDYITRLNCAHYRVENRK